MKTANLLFVFVLLLPACGPAQSPGQVISSCQTVLDAFTDTQVGDIPSYFETENPVKQGGEIDVMDYFDTLDHLSMAPGYVLDYVYHFDGMGGYPVLYVRPDDQEPYPSEAELPESTRQETWLDYVETDDTPESYFQLVLLSMTADQFYLFWHAGYNDSQIVCGKDEVNRIVADVSSESFGNAMPLTARLRASLLYNVAPAVTVYEDTVEVRLLTFTRWGGFYAETYSLERTTPTRILSHEQKNIIHYDCGIMF